MCEKSNYDQTHTQDSQNEEPKQDNHEPTFDKQHNIWTKQNPTSIWKAETFNKQRFFFKKGSTPTKTYHDIGIYEANSPKPWGKWGHHPQQEHAYQ